MFIDQAKIALRGGKGGRGCHSFYRDKYSRKGVPDGGDGGDGADIIIKADRNLYTLLDFRYNRHFFGPDGEHGSGKNKRGQNASGVIIRVPCGTVIRDLSSGCVLRDLKKDAEEVVVARGGKGGLGNKLRPEATEGQPGEEKEVVLDLKLIADAGVAGFPNAGKSTLISAISAAHPKIAAYPFTTKIPILGVVNAGKKNFVIADIPGLIEGSSEGRGLGFEFLRHIERTKIIIHLVDMSGSEGRDPVEDYKIINSELNNYSKQLRQKVQLIVANKMDLENAKLNLKRFKKIVKKRVYPISALEKVGLEELIEAITEEL
jgi:GTPase